MLLNYLKMHSNPVVQSKLDLPHGRRQLDKTALIQLRKHCKDVLVIVLSLHKKKIISNAIQ